MIMNGLSQGGGTDSRVPVIYTTSYVGTGTSGSSNPNTLTFDFVPEFIWIYALDYSFKTNGTGRTFQSLLRYGTNSSSGGPTNFPFCICANLTTNYENYKGLYYYDNSGPVNTYVKKSNDGKTISWYYSYAGSAEGQFNRADQNYNFTYHVLAIGYKEEA